MTRVEKIEEREERIENEAVIDAYNSEERALGWYYYLEGKIQFPFKARCIVVNVKSPLKIGESVRVVGMPDEYECMSEMFVVIEWSGRTFGVPLAQLEATAVNEETQEAIADWHYWVARGYLL